MPNDRRIEKSGTTNQAGRACALSREPRPSCTMVRQGNGSCRRRIRTVANRSHPRLHSCLGISGRSDFGAIGYSACHPFNPAWDHGRTPRPGSCSTRTACHQSYGTGDCHDLDCMRSIVRIARAPLLQIMVSRIGLAFPGRLQQKEPLWLGMSALGQ